MFVTQSTVAWFCRLAVAGLLVACLLAGTPRTYTADQVSLRHWVVYSKKTKHPIDGNLVLRDQAGHLLLAGKLCNGMLCGTVNEWYPDGGRKTRYEYSPKSIGFHRVVEVYSWYPDGTLSDLYQMRDSGDGYVKNGRDLSWYENGVEKHLTTYRLGVTAGVEVVWDKAGNRSMKSLHKDPNPNAPYLIPASFGAAGLDATPGDDTDEDDSDGGD